MPLTLRSADFEPNGSIPPRFTCQGEDVSPSLLWSSVPLETKSLALIVEDPDDAPDADSPKMTWVHWVLFNMPPTITGLATARVPDGADEGLNGWNRKGYSGPCPPIGRHRYFHTLFALDTRLTGLQQPTCKDLHRAMEGHVLAKAELIGTFQKR